MQNKANFIGAQMGANSFVGEDYENKSQRAGRHRENKAKESQIRNNPVSLADEINRRYTNVRSK